MNWSGGENKKTGLACGAVLGFIGCRQGPWNVDLRTPPGLEGSNGSLLCIRRGHPGFSSSKKIGKSPASAYIVSAIQSYGISGHRTEVSSPAFQRRGGPGTCHAHAQPGDRTKPDRARVSFLRAARHWKD